MSAKTHDPLVVPLALAALLSTAACDPGWVVRVEGRIARPLPDACVVRTLDSLSRPGTTKLLTTGPARSWPAAHEGELLRQYGFEIQGQRGVLCQSFDPRHDEHVLFEAYYGEIGVSTLPPAALTDTQPALVRAAAQVLRQCLRSTNEVVRPLRCDPDGEPCRDTLLEEIRTPPKKRAKTARSGGSR